MPATTPVEGMTLFAPGVDAAPDEREPGSRIDPAGEHGRNVRDDLAEREGEVLGDVWARGVPAGAVQRHRHRVAGRGQRPDPQTHLADVEGGFTVQGVDGVDAVEPALVDDDARPSGNDLLGRLEHQPHPDPGAIQLLDVLRQRESGAERSRHVDVVPAGVGHPVDDRRPVEVGAFDDGQRVDVGPQRHPVLRLVRADVGDEAGRVHPAHPVPGIQQPVADGLRRAHLVPRQFRVGVDLTVEGDEPGIEAGEAGLKRLVQAGGGASHGALSVVRGCAPP